MAFDRPPARPVRRDVVVVAESFRQTELAQIFRITLNYNFVGLYNVTSRNPKEKSNPILTSVPVLVRLNVLQLLKENWTNFPCLFFVRLIDIGAAIKKNYVWVKLYLPCLVNQSDVIFIHIFYI